MKILFITLFLCTSVLKILSNDDEILKTRVTLPDKYVVATHLYNYELTDPMRKSLIVSLFSVETIDLYNLGFKVGLHLGNNTERVKLLNFLLPLSDDKQKKLEVIQRYMYKLNSFEIS